MGNGRVRFRALLASTSLTALLVGGGECAGGVGLLHWALCRRPHQFWCDGLHRCQRTVLQRHSGRYRNDFAGRAAGIAVVNGSTISGQISNSGIIAASGFGILIDGTSKINSVGFAIKITGPTFIGSISNAGTECSGQ